jgi:hypothetical protein
MRRHLIVGRFGSSDSVAIPAASGEVATKLDFVAAKQRLEHDIGNSLDNLSKIGVYPSEIGLDLLVLAAHVQAADTHISRSTESQDSWTREIRIVVPVSDPVRWNSVTTLLTRLLNFLTGDRWTIGFRPRPSGFEQAVPERPPQLLPCPFDTVALFSGGLDSLIGAINSIASGRTPLFVSHANEGTVSESQQELFEGLKRKYPRQNFDRLRIWMDFRGWRVRSVKPEKTTRGRSFLFFAAGIFAGTGLLNGFTLQVPENGLIALNVPLDLLRLGAFSTRTTHPFYIARWNELLNALGISARIENPYWDKTKGEMVAQCADSVLLKELVPHSFSCASPAKSRWLGRKTEHCGYCLPCLIRRAALRHGLAPASDPTRYTLANMTSRVLSTKKARGQQIRSLQFAIERLAANPALASLFIHKPGPLSDESPTRQVALADVYRRGFNEINQILAGVRTSPD